MYPLTVRKNMRIQDCLIRILKGNQSYIAYEMMKQNDRKKKVSLKNVHRIAWGGVSLFFLKPFSFGNETG